MPCLRTHCLSSTPPLCPTLPFTSHRPGSDLIEARYKPNQQRLQLRYALDTQSVNYDQNAKNRIEAVTLDSERAEVRAAALFCQRKGGFRGLRGVLGYLEAWVGARGLGVLGSVRICHPLFTFASFILFLPSISLPPRPAHTL